MSKLRPTLKIRLWGHPADVAAAVPAIRAAFEVAREWEAADRSGQLARRYFEVSLPAPVRATARYRARLPEPGDPSASSEEPASSVRIRYHQDGDWQPVKLLEGPTAGGWVRVDDGKGPLWVMVERLHPEDRRTLLSGEGLK